MRACVFHLHIEGAKFAVEDEPQDVKLVSFRNVEIVVLDGLDRGIGPADAGHAAGDLDGREPFKDALVRSGDRAVAAQHLRVELERGGAVAEGVADETGCAARQAVELRGLELVVGEIGHVLVVLCIALRV